MPTKRTRRTRNRRIRTVDSFPVHEWLMFLAGWQPPTTDFERERSPWDSWQAYLADWESVRDDYFHDANTLWRYERTPVAELLYRRFGTDGPPVTMTFSQLEGIISNG